MQFNDLTIYSLSAAIIIALMHINYERIAKHLDRWWPSWSVASGGFAVGYVFLQMLPKLTLFGNKGMDKLPDYPMLGLSLIYVFVLLGFICYWFIDVNSNEETSEKPFWRKIQVANFFFYSILMGELIGSSQLAAIPLVYFLTLSSILFHLAGMNHIFHHWHPTFFHRKMRWLLAIGVILGASGGIFDLFSKAVIGLATAFMGGAILMNVIYYEMPKEKGDKTYPFLGGVLAFALIISYLRYVAN